MIMLVYMTGGEKDTHQEINRKATSVDEYLSASRNNNPLLYPGERPKSSYLTDGETVFTLDPTHDAEGNLVFSMETNDGYRSVDDFLIERSAPVMADRVPVLAFGANVSPGSLASKFAKVGREDALIVSTVYANLHGRDVVWSGGPGINGNFIAILYEGEETKDTDVQVGINFLTREQLLVMNATELSYNLASVELDVDGESVRAFYYVGQDSVFLKDGLPVAIESIPASGRIIESSNTTDLLSDVLANNEIMDGVVEQYPDLEGTTTEGYVAKAATLKAEKKSLVLKKLIHAQIAHNDLSKVVEPADAVSRRESWANPSTLPTLGDQHNGVYHRSSYRLPSEELGQWADPAERQKVLSAITTHLIRVSGSTLKASE